MSNIELNKCIPQGGRHPSLLDINLVKKSLSFGEGHPKSDNLSSNTKLWDSEIHLPNSVLCRYEHLSTPWFIKWRDAMAIPADYRPENRKHWEWCAIAQALSERNMLRPGRFGLGFAVGTEPLPGLFASYGANVLATDRAEDSSGWSASGEHAKGLIDLFNPLICAEDEFHRLVRFQQADMTKLENLPASEFDFVWSSCALEHLGTLQMGLDFIKGAMRLLKPGGVAIHTTEFNCSSNEETCTQPAGVMYRRRDMEQLAAELRLDRVLMSPFDFNAGSSFQDIDYDEPPFGTKPYHIKLLIDGYVSTSCLIIAQKF